MTDMVMSTESAEDLHQGDTWAFRLIFVASYGLFLAAAILGRVFGRRRSVYRPADGRPRSIFGEAKVMALSVIPFVFMS
ncbi:MAG: hypothetical protein ACE363_03635 [Alphaproteobacteria bacterium]